MNGERGMRGVIVLLAVFAALTSPLAAQHRYVESLRTSVTSRSGMAESGRFIVRDVTYLRSQRGDTMVMQAVAARLAETAEGATVLHDTDGFTGGRWKLVPGEAGAWRLVTRPFVPADLLEVSDLAAAMDDFFPVPPVLTPGTSVEDTAGTRWDRLVDSAGAARYRWSGSHEVDEFRTVADSVALRVRGMNREDGSGVWQAAGPVSWQRRIDTESRATLRGVAVLVIVEHRITVARQH